MTGREYGRCRKDNEGEGLVRKRGKRKWERNEKKQVKRGMTGMRGKQKTEVENMSKGEEKERMSGEKSGRERRER